MEWTEIIHPFHPLHGKQFEIINKKKIGNVDTLFLKGTIEGTFAVPQEWTDKSEPSFNNTILDYECLLELVDIVEKLNQAWNCGEGTESNSGMNVKGKSR